MDANQLCEEVEYEMEIHCHGMQWKSAAMDGMRWNETECNGIR